MASLKNKNLIVQQSKISGLGVFALKNLSPNQKILVVKGVTRRSKYSPEEALAFSNDIGIDEEVWITPNQRCIALYLNHSCSANSYLKGKYTVVTKSEIVAGSEITLDYSTIEADPFWSLPYRCACKSINCRKHITSFSNMSEQWQKDNFNYLPKFLKNRISALKG